MKQYAHNGYLSHCQCTNAALFSIGLQGTIFDEIVIEDWTFLYKKNAFQNVFCKMVASLPRSQCVRDEIETEIACSPQVKPKKVCCRAIGQLRHCDVIMSAMVSQITSFTTVYSTVHSGADQRKHQSFASLAFVRKMVSSDGVIMFLTIYASPAAIFIIKPSDLFAVSADIFFSFRIYDMLVLKSDFGKASFHTSGHTKRAYILNSAPL